MLAASAFTANDIKHFFAYPNKIYKWGYFPAVNFSTTRNSNKDDYEINLMWCGRFLDWKHPEFPVLLADRLKKNGYKFHLDMYGNGERLEEIRNLISNLSVGDCVSLYDSLPNEEIIREMHSHDIFLFTSDRNEGWGAVLNESMSQGCAVVVSDMIGSAPFLIDNGRNGLLFESENLTSFYSQVSRLLDDKHLRLSISENAVRTMQELWSPRVAAQRFVDLASRLLVGRDTEYSNGPCSKAYPYKK